MKENRKRPAAMRVIELENGDTPFEQLLARLYRTEKTQAGVARALGREQNCIARLEDWAAANLGIRVEREVKVVHEDGSLV